MNDVVLPNEEEVNSLSAAKDGTAEVSGIAAAKMAESLPTLSGSKGAHRGGGTRHHGTLGPTDARREAAILIEFTKEDSKWTCEKVWQ